MHGGMYSCVTMAACMVYMQMRFATLSFGIDVAHIYIYGSDRYNITYKAYSNLKIFRHLKSKLF